MQWKVPIITMTLIFGLSACGDDDPDPTNQSKADKAFELELMAKLIEAKPGDVIEIPAGTHYLSRGLSLNVDGVTVRGEGMDTSILSFAAQIAGAEGLLVNADDFVIEDLAIEDAKGDALKINEGRNIVIRRIRTEWTNGPDTDNGAYGIYPVQVENVLIDGVVAIGASDAGIYVGQSRNAVVRNSRAEFNVAGIEIENTVFADVHDNLAINNTGGILVFNMPDLRQPGHSTRVFDNRIIENNTDNFGPEGTAVASIPAGSGIVINANDRVEIFGNEIADNRTANIIIASAYSADFFSEEGVAEDFDPYPETIYIHDNAFRGGGDTPDDIELKFLKISKFGINGRLPDILWDGIVNPARTVDGRLPADLAICINDANAAFMNLDAGNGYSDISIDKTPHDCRHEGLPPVRLHVGSGAQP